MVKQLEGFKNNLKLHNHCRSTVLLILHSYTLGRLVAATSTLYKQSIVSQVYGAKKAYLVILPSIQRWVSVELAPGRG